MKKKKKNTQSVQYALRWRLMGNRWRLVGNPWRLEGKRWGKHADINQTKKKRSQTQC